MKVIVRGTPPKEVRYRCNCSTCKSTVEYTGEDIVELTDNQRDGLTHFLGECPVCGAQLFDYVPRWYEEHDGRGPG